MTLYHWNNLILPKSVDFPQVSAIKSIIAFPLGRKGEYSVLRLCIVPPCGRANTATLELNIPLYCPPSHIIIYIYSIHDILTYQPVI